MPISANTLRQISVIIFTLMLAAIFIGGEMPGAGNLFPTPWDKVVHFLTFGSIALLAGLSFPTRPLPLILLMVACLGAADEIHQIFMEGRQPGFDDLLADIAGALLALPLIPGLRKILYKL